MKVATHFRDPQSYGKLLLEHLLEVLPPADAKVADADVVTRLPEGTPERGLLTVAAEDWPEYVAPVTAVSRLRVVSWDLDPDVAYDRASWAHGRLLAWLPTSEYPHFHSFAYDSGPRRGTDPDFNTPIAAFTIRARMVPEIL